MRIFISLLAHDGKADLLSITGDVVLMSIVFGVLASIVYSLVGSQVIYMAIPFGLAALFSILAVASKTSMTGDKVVWNLAIGVVLGILVPVLAGG